jgi:hypothetical protein
MRLTRLPHLKQEVDDLLMLGEPFLGRPLESGFQERHIKASLVRRAPSRAGAGRQDAFTVHLRQGSFVDHTNARGTVKP